MPAGARYAAAGPGLNRFVVAGRRGAGLIRRDGQLLARLPHPARVERAAFSPNGLLIATAGADGDAVLWDGAGRRRHVFRGADDGRIFDVAFSRLSRLLATAGSDGTARVWNIRTGGRVSIMALHGNQVRRASFGANEDALLTASRDRTARTWKVDTGGPRAAAPATRTRSPRPCSSPATGSRRRARTEPSGRGSRSCSRRCARPVAAGAAADP